MPTERRPLLGIQGLPDTLATLLPGHIYCVCVEGETWPLLAKQTLLSSTGQRILISDHSAVEQDGVLFQALESSPSLQTLHLMRISAQQARLETKPIARLLEELDYFGLGGDALLLLDRLLLGSNQSELQLRTELAQLRQWALTKRCAVLLLISSELKGQGELLRSVDDAFSGLAQLAALDGLLQLTISHWRAGMNLVASQSLSVECDSDRVLRISDSSRIELMRQTASVKQDEGRVLATHRIIADADERPSHWQLYNSNEMAIRAVEGSASATLLLHFSSTTELASLAREILQLRQQQGPHLKIIVREMQSRLRHADERVLLRAGVNLIVPAELNFSRLLGLLESCQGQSLTRSLGLMPQSDDPVVSELSSGYYRMPEFVRRCRQALRQSERLGVQVALIRLQMLPGLPPLDALRVCALRRPGDISSADEQHLYLFLYACRETDVSKTLGSLFLLPPLDLFADESRFLAQDVIRWMVDDLDALERKAPQADYSQALHAQSQAITSRLSVGDGASRKNAIRRQRPAAQSASLAASKRGRDV